MICQNEDFCSMCPMTHLCVSRLNRQNNVSCIEILKQGFKEGNFVLHQSPEQYQEAIDEGSYIACVDMVQTEEGEYARVLTTADGRMIYDEDEIEGWLRENVGDTDEVLQEDDTDNSGDNHNSLYDSQLSI